MNIANPEERRTSEKIPENKIHQLCMKNASQKLKKPEI